jgi:hypothetical protein
VNGSGCTAGSVTLAIAEASDIIPGHRLKFDDQGFAGKA